jgi:hypothetical protein
VTEPLPQRPFTALPTPPDGVQRALRDGRRLRLRRRLAGAGAAALSVAVAVGAAVVLGPGTTGASDSLVPATRPSATSTPSPGDPDATAAPAGPSPEPAPSTSPGASASPAAAPEPAGGSPAPAEQQAPAPEATPAGTSYRTPDLTRRYQPAPPTTGGPAGRICGGGSEYGGNGLTNGTGYCLAGYAVATERGHDLVVEVCRDSTGPGRLRFPRELEADLLVHDPSSEDRVVWQWSAGRSNDQDVHSLDVETSACWTWTAPWTDVDAQGRALDPGRYELEVRSRADEVRTYQAERVAFTVS